VLPRYRGTGQEETKFKTWTKILTFIKASLPISDCMLSPAWITVLLEHRAGSMRPRHKPFLLFPRIDAGHLGDGNRTRFFSTTVRLQTDRGHQVATGGPYRVVRHPGYVGFIITTIAGAAHTRLIIRLNSIRHISEYILSSGRRWRMQR